MANASSSVEHDPRASLLKLPREQSRWLSGLARGAAFWVALATAAPLASGVILVFQAWLLARVLGQAIVAHTSLAILLPNVIGIGVILLVRAALAWLGDYAGVRAAEDIKLKLRLSLMGRLLQAGPLWSRQRASGELANCMVDQAEALDGFFARYLSAACAAVFLPVAFSVVVLPVDVVSGILLLITAPLIPLFMALVGWGAEAASKQHMQAFVRLTGFFADRLRGIDTLVMFGRAQAECDIVVRASESLRARTMAVLRIAFLSSAVLEFFAALGVAGVAVYIGLTLLHAIHLRSSPLTLQASMFCLLMAPEVYAPLRQFAAHYHDRGAARAAVAQIAERFDPLPDVNVPVNVSMNAASMSASVNASLDASANTSTHASMTASVNEPSCAVLVSGPGRMTSSIDTPTIVTGSALSLSLHDLRLDAPGRMLPVLDAVNLEVAPGEHVAVMGASGVGKSTLLEALARLRPVQSGTIDLGGVRLDQWDEAALRAHVMLIGQRPYLFSGSILENIRLVRPGASRADVEDAARRAVLLDPPGLLPAGLDTQIGQRGQGLSGGQAQRVALARLYLCEPGLILLDEPTAFLDAATQAQAMRHLLAFAQGRTLILVTHAQVVAQALPRVVTLAPSPQGSATITEMSVSALAL